MKIVLIVVLLLTSCSSEFRAKELESFASYIVDRHGIPEGDMQAHLEDQVFQYALTYNIRITSAKVIKYSEGYSYFKLKDQLYKMKVYVPDVPAKIRLKIIDDRFFLIDRSYPSPMRKRSE